MFQLPATYMDVILKLIFSLLALLLTLVANRALRNLLLVRVKDPAHVHTLHMLIRNSVFLAGSVVILLIWLGVGSNFTVAMGILGAGIAFASQEVIGSFAGYLNIVTGNLFRIGDRVRIGNVVGDVLDISMLRTKVMEIGEWVQADQYTGRIVTLANRVVFSDPVFNYTHHWRYLWDEITIPITYDSDWRCTGEIMLKHGREYTSHFQAQAEAEFRALVKSYPVHEMTVEPTLYIVMTDNWIEMTLRYVVEARERRQVKGQLHHRLLQHFESEADITVASATFEIVGFPPLKSDVGNSCRQAANTVPPGQVREGCLSTDI
ncbi:MAG: mechanosensitive ion channel [Chloroflexota bacterium]|nr:mechanosensitive ion channel [Chloroflexota bacterium]